MKDLTLSLKKGLFGFMVERRKHVSEKNYVVAQNVPSEKCNGDCGKGFVFATLNHVRP